MQKLLSSATDTSGGFAVKPDYVNSVASKNANLHEAVPEFITGMDNGNLKTRLQSLWESYEDAYSSYGELIILSEKFKVFCGILLKPITNLLRDIYANESDFSSSRVRESLNIGWEMINNAFDQFPFKYDDFGEGSALEKASDYWKDIVDLESEQAISQEDESYRGMISSLENSVSIVQDISEGGKSPLSVRAKEFGDNALSLFKDLLKDLSSAGFKGEFYWISPANQDYTEEENVEEKAQIETNGVALDDDTKTIKSEKAVEEDDGIPNYHLAIDVSPRVCGSCRFFQNIDGKTGNCSVFDFVARANYVCDAWQAITLTASHTPVRSVDGVKAEIQNTPLVSEVIPGKVQGQTVVLVPSGEVPQDVTVSGTYTEGSTSSTALVSTPITVETIVSRGILPGDKVYSESLRSMGVVTSTVKIDGVEGLVCSIRLIDGNGVEFGTAQVAEADLTRKTEKALKKEGEPKKKVKSEEDMSVSQPVNEVVIPVEEGVQVQEIPTSKTDIEEMRKDEVAKMVARVRAIRSEVNSVIEQFALIEGNPSATTKWISNKEHINPLIKMLNDELNSPLFEGVKTGQKRKYYRAMQNCEYAVGAAKQVLFSSYKEINDLNEKSSTDASKASFYKSEKRKSALNGQRACYERLKTALAYLDDSLLLPSATHNEDAPGLSE